VLVGRRRQARGLAAATTTILALIAPAKGVGRATADMITPVPLVEQSLIVKINGLRARHGLRRLQPSSALGGAARLHTRQMLAGGYFAHGAVWRRITAYYRNPSAVGENMVWGTGQLSASRALTLWLASPSHRANLLSPMWRRIGIGAAYDRRAGGVYGNRPATVIVADFGAP
jgi:uncharacterized protein YkwD